MKNTKLYRHLRHVRATLIVRIDEKPFTVDFANGTLSPRINGFYKTDDTKVQKALESNSQFGKLFTLERVNGKPVNKTHEGEDVVSKYTRAIEEQEAKYNELKNAYDELLAENAGLKLELKDKKPVETPVEETPETPEEPEAPETTEKNVIEVKNLQEAKEILKGEPYNVAPNRMIQEAALLNRAAELNIEFKFPE